MKRLQSVQSHLNILLKDKKFKAIFEKERRKLTQGEMLAMLKRLWKKYSYLRLGQLISNVAQGDDVYYIPDNLLVDRMREYKI